MADLLYLAQGVNALLDWETALLWTATRITSGGA